MTIAALPVAEEASNDAVIGAVTLDCRELPPRPGDELTPKPITEPLLASWIENGAVTGITIKETTEGFKVLVSVTWDRQSIYELQTQRSNKPKLWSSLNRLVQQLSRYPSLPPVKLEVRTSKNEIAAKSKKPPARRA
ncbi:hypothetical protein LMG31884_47510 (plasmid) [Xanthomonas hydrangeae]|nr:hypothetical protein LMG31884_47510 [Xanthomonas hydrangeae]CAD7741286.1 hypothetical protein LMG31884_47510 [Xanthomonas hydrangeae]CAD7747928.1 hypothetical protein LMG31887_46350 [Xanthomonas hydrangeae]CAD7747929.1 hypothetical protein LMG31887_46350 [Xanthomonas hydrangeae]CAD7748194.1 hypothetical protein LMG31885_45140 [Xanthomonas hydrangeae]